jgi:protein-disulfide isomerase-like protein with CxxC motif
MDRVRFHFDPLCPWCYQTSRWAIRLEQLGEIELAWGLFSLEVVNAAEGTDPRTLEARSGPALRTAIRIREKAGAGAVGPFYTALGRRIWEQAPPEQDMATAVRGALAEIDLDPAWCDEALGDPASWDAVLDEHNALVERTHSFGVPTIILDGGEGPAIFGPVISTLPSDDDAVELWRHVSWLARYENFSELKRDRPQPPDLPAMAWRLARRAEKGAG